MKLTRATVPALALTVIVFAGCNGNGSTSTPAVALSGSSFSSTIWPAAVADRMATANSATNQAKTTPLVYVSLYESNAVKYFAEAGHRQPVLGQITNDINEPEGLAVAPNGDLYVANGSGGAVPVFHKGGKTPYETLTGFGVGASDVTVDNEGTVFVASGSIYVFAGGAKTPTSELHIARPRFPVHIATDSKGDLFAQTETNSDNGAHVEMFPAGSKKAIDLPITTNSAGGLAVTGGDDLVVCDAGLDDGYQGGIYVYRPPYTSGPIFSVMLFGDATACATSKKPDRIWAAEGPAVEYTPELHRIDAVSYGNGVTFGIAAER